MNLRKIYLFAFAVLALSACTKQQNTDLGTAQSPTNEKGTITRKSAPSVPISATMRGSIHNPDRTIEAVYGIDAEGVFTIDLTEVAKLSDDKSTLQSYEVNMDGSGTVVIPSSSTDFWLIPFDPTQQPMRIAGGTSVTQTCNCPGGGSGCTMTVTDDCKASCNQGTCSSENDCTLQSDNPPAIAISIGSALLLPATAVIFNGIRYE